MTYEKSSTVKVLKANVDAGDVSADKADDFLLQVIEAMFKGETRLVAAVAPGLWKTLWRDNFITAMELIIDKKLTQSRQYLEEIMPDVLEVLRTTIPELEYYYHRTLVSQQATPRLRHHWLAMCRDAALGLYPEKLYLHIALAGLTGSQDIHNKDRHHASFGEGLMTWYMTRSAFDMSTDRELVKVLTPLFSDPAKIVDLLIYWETLRSLRKYSHDDDRQHSIGALAASGFAYLHLDRKGFLKKKDPIMRRVFGPIKHPGGDVPNLWKLPSDRWKPRSHLRDLLRANVLITAEKRQLQGINDPDCMEYMDHLFNTTRSIHAVMVSVVARHQESDQ